MQPLWPVSLGVLAVVGFGVNGASHSVFTLWPQEMNATLSRSATADGSSVIKASFGGALATINMNFNMESEILLDPLLDSIKITWVPATDAHSSTFDHLWISSFGFERVNSVGIHLQATLKDKAAESFSDKAFDEKMEMNVRDILHQILPSIEILPNLPHGFLAKSFCDYRSWKTSNPLNEILHERVAKSPTLCYSTSFPFTLKSKSYAWFNKTTHDAVVDSLSSVERALLETNERFNTKQSKRRLTAMKLSRHAASSTKIKADISRVWVYQSLEEDAPWQTLVPVYENCDFQIITSVMSELGSYKLEQASIYQDGKPLALEVCPSVKTVQLPKRTVAASVQVAILGAGFHRRYVMDVKLLETEVCGKRSRDKLILLRVPISETTYVDLDEIRRMERFGDLKLLSFTKHIEIERPSPVSSQHVLGLEFTIPSTTRAQFEFPLHFRYQAPSENELYRQASVMAPDLFLFCPDQSVTTTQNVSHEESAKKHFEEKWGHVGLPNARHGDSQWFQLTTKSPLPVINVLTPIGYLPSAWLVSSVTLLFASMGAALLLRVSLGV